MNVKTLLLILGGLILAEYGTGLIEASSAIPPAPSPNPTPISPPAPTSGGGTSNLVTDAEKLATNPAVITTATGAVVSATTAVADAVAGAAGSVGQLVIAVAVNPITWVVAAGIGIAVLWYKSQAHHQADEWVQQFQNPFDSRMAAIDNEAGAGKITGEEAFQFRRAQVADYIQAMNQFASQGDNQALVIRQAKSTFAYWYGADPDQYLANVTADLQALGVAV